MFETKIGQNYELFRNINEDPFTFKQQAMKDSLDLNWHMMLEL